MTDSAEAWSGFENDSKKVGRKSEEENVQGEILSYQREQGLPKELHERGRGVKKLLLACMVPAWTWRVHASGDGVYREI